MSNRDKDAILELFEFNEKKVLCTNIDKTYIHGLIDRGADVWFDESKKKIANQIEIELNYKQKINFYNSNLKSNFDYLIVNDVDYNYLNINEALFAKEKIVIIKGTINVFKLFLRLNKSFNKEYMILYSVAPSLNNIKVIIPEKFNVSIQRYWTLRSSNPFISIKLFLEWFCINNGFLRKFFTDKLVVVK
tara:strand:- start:154 stop:723 length:570 start_codon:yes stop_codon:yes gene_type:complete